MQGPLADAWIVAQIDAAVAPYARHLPAEELAWMREQLAETLMAEGRARDALRGAYPRVVERSGEVGTGGASGEAPLPRGRRRRAG